jgi:hypothetical protein
MRANSLVETTVNMKLGNLPVAAPAKDVLEPRFVDRALAKLGTYRKN